MKKYAYVSVIRILIMACVLLFTVFLSAFISVHAICPIGGFELFFTGLFSTGFTLAGLFSGMVIVFLIMSVISILFRRAYCGYICPMGTIQEFFSFAGKKLLPSKIKKARIPPQIASVLRFVKYGILILFVLGAAFIGGHWMLPGDPFIVLMSLASEGGIVATFERLPVAVIFFGLILITAFFAGRLFCRFVCPAGAWYALLSKASPSRIVRDQEKCIHCNLCSQVCPVDIPVANLTAVTTSECIGCCSCERACPKDALSYKIAGASVPKVLVPVTAGVIFAGSVWLSHSMLPKRSEGGRSNGQGNRGRAYQEKSTVSGKKSSVAVSGCGGNCSACGLCSGILSAAADRV